MKLKYYLRGLATGLVIATMILTIANRDNKPLTDAQIRQRAMELGMIDSDSRKLSSLQGNETQESTAAEPSSSAAEPSSSAAEPSSSAAEPSSSAAEPSSSAAEPSSSAAEPSSSVAEPGSSAAEPSSSAAEPSSSAAEPSSSAAEPSSSAAEPSSSATGDGAVTIYIPGGATSYTVSQQLAAAGLVADAKEYDAFLCDNGYAHTIRVGTYEILPGTSEEEIAKMIAR